MLLATDDLKRSHQIIIIGFEYYYKLHYYIHNEIRALWMEHFFNGEYDTKLIGSNNDTVTKTSSA